MKLTTHTIVKNEDHWVWFALKAWEPFATKMLVVNDSSTDNTEAILKTLTSKNITYSNERLVSPQDLTHCRNSMLAQTSTDWFLLLDGDEIWNTSTIQNFLAFLEHVPKDIYGVAMRTRNLVGDIYHYLPEEAGKYNLLGKTGHLTIRAYKKLPGFKWVGDYPLEAYVDASDKAISSQPEHLAFFDGFYWHTTHLTRSSSPQGVKGWRTKKLELGLKVQAQTDFPEVFFEDRPAIVPNPFQTMSAKDLVLASALTPIKKLRRKLLP